MKKLFKIKNHNTLLGGVFLGLSNYLNIDVTILRLLGVGAFFTPVPIVFLYILAWIIVPVGDESMAVEVN